jgi:hypothetical protein
VNLKNGIRTAVAGILLGLLAFAPMAQAGLFGALAGDAMQHIEAKKQQADQQRLLTDHPAVTAIAGTAAAVETAHVGNDVAHVIWHHRILAAAGGLVATGIANDQIRDYLEKHDGCTNDDPPYWKCEGVPGQHIFDIEAKDYYFTRSEHGEALSKSLEASGEPAKNGCDPHHIVPWNEGRKWAKSYADGAREILDKCRINIDSAQNGIWLPKSQDAECEGAWHPRIHNKKYYIAVFEDLRKAMMTNGRCKNVKNALERIKLGLENKTYTGVRPMK